MAIDAKDCGAANDTAAATAPRAAGRRPVRVAQQAVIACVIVFVLILAGMLVWRSQAGDYHEQLAAAQRQIESLRQGRDAAVAAAVSSAHRELDARAAYLMRLSAVPLAWAIRADLIVGNLQRLEAYMNEFSREELVTSVLLADAKGQIILASNKALEKQKFDAVYPVEYLDVDSPTMRRDDQGAYRMVLPIMGLSARAGTLVVVYTGASAQAAPK